LQPLPPKFAFQNVITISMGRIPKVSSNSQIAFVDPVRGFLLSKANTVFNESGDEGAVAQTKQPHQEEHK
jgi:hypothetical protein